METVMYMIYNITDDFYWMNRIFWNKDDAEETAKSVIYKHHKFEIKKFIINKTKYMTIIDKDHNVLVSMIGNFTLTDDIILDKTMTIFISEVSPLFDTSEINEKDGKPMIKYYPENQKEG